MLLPKTMLLLTKLGRNHFNLFIFLLLLFLSRAVVRLRVRLFFWSFIFATELSPPAGETLKHLPKTSRWNMISFYLFSFFLSRLKSYKQSVFNNNWYITLADPLASVQDSTAINCVTERQEMWSCQNIWPFVVQTVANVVSNKLMFGTFNWRS